MDLIRIPAVISVPPANKRFMAASLSKHNFPFPFWTHPFGIIPRKSYTLHAKKRNSRSEQDLKSAIIGELELEDDSKVNFPHEALAGEELEFDEFFEDDKVEELEDDDTVSPFEGLEGEALMDVGDEDDFKDDLLEDEVEIYVGDGSGGGGIALAGTWWDEEALRVAEEVCDSFDGELKLYAFRTMSNSTIQVRIERLTNKSGSPSMEDIEIFSTIYRARLDEAELAKTIPDNVALEVSSPGVERVVRIPEELDRFKDRPMYVKYVSGLATLDSSSVSESDGVFKLISFDLETECCTWGLADVRINREKAGKGRPLSKKQREWRLDTPFDSLRLVRLYSEI